MSSFTYYYKCSKDLQRPCDSTIQTQGEDSFGVNRQTRKPNFKTPLLRVFFKPLDFYQPQKSQKTSKKF
jgi:hypothetical protein